MCHGEEINQDERHNVENKMMSATQVTAIDKILAIVLLGKTEISIMFLVISNDFK